MKFTILTLFPEMINGYINSSIINRAIKQGLIEVEVINFRDFAGNKHNTVDDYAYGGGAGMLLRVDPIARAIKSVDGFDKALKIVTTPSGKQYNQKIAEKLSTYDHLIIVCGHYEGFDNRVLNYVDEEISIGDYVLTGGEMPALAILDSVSRLIPGVISDDSITKESFSMGLLEYPQYTRPYEFEGLKVPDVVISGHHAKIEEFKLYESLKKTLNVRPDLLEKIELSDHEKKILQEIKNEKN